MDLMPPPLTTALHPHPIYSDSTTTSPHSRHTDDDSLPPIATKLRLMCSYGGHIVPRPHDKSLCYIGGDTRIVFSDRLTSLSDIKSRLSKTLLNNRDFSLKYLLPNEDLDSLISVTSDDDLEIMIEEYDRISTSSAKPSRLRLFLFPLKPDSSQSLGPILENSIKSEDWFFNALNGSGLLNRVFSDPKSVNFLLGLDDDCVVNGSSTCNPVLNSPVVETTSSFGSASSAPSDANLPAIGVNVEDGGGVRVQDQKVGIEKQFAQMGFVASVPVSSLAVSGEYQNQVLPDDVQISVGSRKEPQPKSSGSLELPYSDSVSSDISIMNIATRAKPMIYQENSSNVSDPNAWVQMQQPVRDSGYMLQPQFDPKHQQFVHAGTHYAQHHPTGPTQIPGYYPAYPSRHQLDQQFPVYYMPARQGQAYNLSVQQPNISEAATSVPTSFRQMPSSPAMFTTPVSKPDMAAGIYRMTTAAAPQSGHVPYSQHNQRYVGFSQIQHPSQSVTPASAATTSYAYEFADAAHAHIYYSQPHQTMTAANSVGFPQTSAQLSSDTIKQQIRISQPI